LQDAKINPLGVLLARQRTSCFYGFKHAQHLFKIAVWHRFQRLRSAKQAIGHDENLHAGLLCGQRVLADIIADHQAFGGVCADFV
jgi:hypothetical protein